MRAAGTWLGIFLMVALGIAVACTSEPAAPAQLVTAETLARLSPGQRLVVEHGGDHETAFDFSLAPIDWSRIELVDPHGRKVAMSEILAAQGTAELLTSADRSFRLATPPSGGLSPDTWYCFEYMNENGEVEWICVDI